MEKLSSRRFYLVRLLHRKIHSEKGNRKTLKGNQIIVLTVRIDEGTVQSRLGNRSDVRTGGLCGRRMPGKPGSVGHWGGDQRSGGRPRSDREVDRAPGQQR